MISVLIAKLSQAQAPCSSSTGILARKCNVAPRGVSSSRRLMVSLTTRRRKLLLEGVGIFWYSISNHYVMVSHGLMVSLTTRRRELLLVGLGFLIFHIKSLCRFFSVSMIQGEPIIMFYMVALRMRQWTKNKQINIRIMASTSKDVQRPSLSP